MFAHVTRCNSALCDFWCEVRHIDADGDVHIGRSIGPYRAGERVTAFLYADQDVVDEYRIYDDVPDEVLPLLMIAALMGES